MLILFVFYPQSGNWWSNKRFSFQHASLMGATEEGKNGAKSETKFTLLFKFKSVLVYIQVGNHVVRKDVLFLYERVRHLI